MTEEAEDLMWRSLRRLPVIEPDPARSERARVRCHAALARRRQRLARCHASRSRALEPVLVGGLCLMYLAALVEEVLRLHLWR